jgi:hypothetical protein
MNGHQAGEILWTEPGLQANWHFFRLPQNPADWLDLKRFVKVR